LPVNHFLRVGCGLPVIRHFLTCHHFLYGLSPTTLCAGSLHGDQLDVFDRDDLDYGHWWFVIDRNSLQGIELQHLDLLSQNWRVVKVGIQENRWAHSEGGEIDEEMSRRGSKPNRVLPQLENLKVAPTNKQGFFAKMKSYIKHLLRL